MNEVSYFRFSPEADAHLGWLPGRLLKANGHALYEYTPRRSCDSNFKRCQP